MSWSLRLHNGDLTLNQANYGTVTGEAKLAQDLRCYILERMGLDDMHPDYGSILDGGTLSDGTEAPGFIGLINDDFTQLQIESELQRIVNSYQGLQLARAQDDQLVYGKTTLTRNEILLSASFNFDAEGDTLNVTLSLTTAANSTVDLTLDLTDNITSA
jgi:hypothetical protein